MRIEDQLESTSEYKGLAGFYNLSEDARNAIANK